MISCFFFFSSRRRHTRLQGDWSSDVCSSDLEPDDLQKGPLPPSRPDEEQGAGSGTLREAAEAAEREAIRASLEAVGGNRREAAKRLGVSLRTLFYKMERYGLGECKNLHWHSGFR